MKSKASRFLALKIAAGALALLALVVLSFLIWIGLSYDVRHKRWKWTTGEPVEFVKWRPGEPNRLDREHVTLLDQGGDGSQWNNLVPNAKRPFVCEWDR